MIVQVVENLREIFISPRSIIDSLQNLVFDLLVQLSTLFVFVDEVIQDSEYASHRDPNIIAFQECFAFCCLDFCHRTVYEPIVGV